MMKSSSVFVTALGCLLAVAGCGNGSAGNGAQENEFPTMEVTTSDVVLSEQYPATIQGRQDIEIRPQVSGTISKVNVKEGQKVRKGQSLFTIDQVPFKAALQMAQANVESAEAGVATAQLVYNSRVELYAKNVISEFDLLTAKNQLLTANAGLALLPPHLRHTAHSRRRRHLHRQQDAYPQERQHHPDICRPCQ